MSNITLNSYCFRSLQLGSIHDIIESKLSNNCQAQIELSGVILKNIEDILKLHVKHNESKVISKEEIIALQAQLPLLNSIQEEIQILPKPQEALKEQLVVIDAIQSTLKGIISTINSTKTKVENLQQDVAIQSSDILYYSI